MVFFGVKNIVTRPTKQIYKNYTKEDFKVWNILFKRQLKHLNDIIGSLMIKQFKGNQKEYRAVITAIMQEYFKTNLEENDN